MLIDNVKKYAEKKNLSIAAVERKANIGNGIIGKWERRNPNLGTLKKVAEVLEVPVEELLKE